MSDFNFSRGRSVALILILLLFHGGFAPVVLGETLRIVDYNIEADIDGVTTPRTGLDTVLEAIGEQDMNGILQPLDILALQETTSNFVTESPIVMDLNTYYGSDIYAMSPYQGTTSRNNPSGGNGPNGLIYNTQTLRLISSIGVGSPLGVTNGEYRQVTRYEFEPVGGTAANDFYIYVSHMKSNASGTAAAVEASRNQEAMIIRADEATLSADASVLYMGDYNLKGSTEDAYKTMTAAGQGQAVDPLNPSLDYTQVWSHVAFKAEMTQSPTAIADRDDLQLMTQNIYSGSDPLGLTYLPGSYRAFGNDGSTGGGKSVNLSTNTALNNLVGPISASDALNALTTGSDHLPVVVDYTIAVPEPSTVCLLGIGIAALSMLSRRSWKQS